MHHVTMIILLALLLVFPVVMIIRAWRIGRIIHPLVAICALISHTVIAIVSWTAHLSWVFYSYLILINLLWGISLFFGEANDAAHRIHLREQDIAKYERMLRARPENAAVLSALADAYFEGNRLEEAVQAYDKATALDPNHGRDDRWKRQQAVKLLERREKAQSRPADEKV